MARVVRNAELVSYHPSDYEQAEPLYRESLQITRRLLSGDHPNVSLFIHNPAFQFYNKGDYLQVEKSIQGLISHEH